MSSRVCTMIDVLLLQAVHPCIRLACSALSVRCCPGVERVSFLVFIRLILWGAERNALEIKILLIYNFLDVFPCLNIMCNVLKYIAKKVVEKWTNFVLKLSSRRMECEKEVERRREGFHKRQHAWRLSEVSAANKLQRLRCLCSSICRKFFQG